MEIIISIKNLVNEFGSNRIHDNLSLDIIRDEILGVVGGSGSGKSVLMHSILGLHRITSGTITVRGKPIIYHESNAVQDWGVLFQSGALLSGLTVQENIELPITIHSDMPAKIRSELARLKINMVGLPMTAANKFPAELSGGMIKRAALARALALEPNILFLDEPTAGLDPIAATEFSSLLKYLNANLDLTIVMITHDLDTLFDVCDRIAILVDKQVTIGTPEEITKLEHPWIKNFFGNPRAQRAHQFRENKG